MFRARHPGEHLLALCREQETRPLGIIALRPRLAPGVHALVEQCRLHGVDLCLLPGDDLEASQALAQRTHIPLLAPGEAAADSRAADLPLALATIHRRQQHGEVVAFASDNAHAGAAFEACDLAVGLTTGRGVFPARADFLAPDLEAVAALVDAGARSKAAARDAVAFSLLSNIAGSVVGLRTAVPLENASTILYGAAFAALGDQWLRTRGGERAQAAIMRIADPRPERWGARSVAEVLKALDASPDGLTSAQVSQRARAVMPVYKRRPLWQLVLDQVRSPLTAIMGVGAAAAFVFGAPADVAIVGATIVGNVALGAWQARKADQVTESLNRMGTTFATVLRDGQPKQLSAARLVPGDVLLLAPGTRIAADARLIEAQHLEVDEAALTGESIPVAKAPGGANGTKPANGSGPSNGSALAADLPPSSAASRIVLDGSDVTTGTGRAVVFAVGRGTRMGATAAALSTDERTISPLDTRLSQALQQIVPISVAGGALVSGLGFLRTRQAAPAIAVGATIALTSIPEGLPILARVTEGGSRAPPGRPACADAPACRGRGAGPGGRRLRR